MIPLTLTEIASAVGGTIDAGGEAGVALRVTGPVVVDSREVVPGSMFVAVRGEHVDGHEFANDAVRGGAAGVLAERSVGVPAVVVADVVSALGQLARHVLDRLPGLTVVGLTGSSGKTTTKDLLAFLLSRLGPTVAPTGSFNNEIGLPLTVLRADENTRHLVLEMGARGIGHIAGLCATAPPTVGVVLNVGSAHIGEFGGREGVAAAKGELVEALPPAGLAVLNADDPFVTAMTDRTQARVVWFGHSTGADVRADDVTLDARGRASFTLHAPEGSGRVTLRFTGSHQVSNALAAACTARGLGMPVDVIAAALCEAVPTSRWRMEVSERPDGALVVNDAYNANPESVRAALEALVAMGSGRRTWAVLGEMRELGDRAAAEHEAVGALVAQLGVTRLVAVGEGAALIHQAASEPVTRAESSYVPDVESAVALVRDQVRPHDVVLVKASRAVGLERVAAALLEEGEGGGTADEAGGVRTSGRAGADS